MYNTVSSIIMSIIAFAHSFPFPLRVPTCPTLCPRHGPLRACTEPAPPISLTDSSPISLTESSPQHPPLIYTLLPFAERCTVRPSPLSPTPSPIPLPPRRLRNPLLPANYATSVGPTYPSWALWHTSRHITRNAYYVLGTTSLLRALGLGAVDSLAVAATLKWVLKDGLGLTAKLLLSTQLARVVDRHAKPCRVLGDALMAVSALVEILSVAHPHAFLFFGAAAALLRDTASALSGPSYRVFLHAFARCSNIGDVSARGEAQVVLGNLVGLALGTALVATQPTSVDPMHALPATLASYSVLAAAHMGCTYRAVRTVQLDTLNWQRLALVARTFLSDGAVPSVDDVNRREGLFFVGGARPWGGRLRVGASLRDFAACGAEVRRAVADGKGRFIIAYNGGCAGVMLREDAEVLDVLRGYLSAGRLLDCVDGMVGKGRRGVGEGLSRDEVEMLTRESSKWAEEAFPRFLDGLEEQGWSTVKLLMHIGDTRYSQRDLSHDGAL